ncbi:MAG: PHP-associated domain-containing protein [Candidatus Zixiibacteriota bacterium]
MIDSPKATVVIHRLLFHVHTRRSHDSTIRPEQIVAFARQHRIGCVIVTDHDSHLGSQDCARLAGSDGPCCPLAAEYRTTQGEIIAAFLEEPMRTRDPKGLIEKTHEQGGIVILPHPFRSQSFPDAILTACDVIEIFNSRVPDGDNARALALAGELGKPFLAGADAHLPRELGLAVNEYETTHDQIWIDLIRQCRPVCRTEKSTIRAMRESQMIKACRRLNPVLLAKSVIRWTQAAPDQKL